MPTRAFIPTDAFGKMPNAARKMRALPNERKSVGKSAIGPVSTPCALPLKLSRSFDDCHVPHHGTLCPFAACHSVYQSSLSI